MSEEQKLLQFCELSGLDPDVAGTYLALSDYNLERALNLYFTDEANGTVIRPDQGGARPHPAPGNAAGGNAGVAAHADDSDDEEMQQYRNLEDAFGVDHHGVGVADDDDDFDPRMVPDRDVPPPNYGGLPAAQVVPNALQNLTMFQYPDYVKRVFGSIEAECQKGVERDAWVLLAMADGEFISQCLPRDVWRNETVKVLCDQGDLGGNIMCYELSVLCELGRVLVGRYGLAGTKLPVLLIINPHTTRRELTIECPVTDRGGLDPAPIVENLLEYTQRYNRPSDLMRSLQEDDEDDRNHGSDNTSHQQPDSALNDKVVDVDTTDNSDASRVHSPGPLSAAHTPQTSLTPASGRPAGAAAAAAAAVPLASSSAPATAAEPLTEPTLGQWSADGEYQLRLRFPDGLAPIAISVRGATPSHELYVYAAAYLRYARPEQYAAAPPEVKLFTSDRPPTEVPNDAGVTIADIPAIRKRDVLNVVMA